MITVGIDVSKKKLDVLWLKAVSTRKVKARVFSNDPAGHQELIAWILKAARVSLHEVSFIMEATGVYHESLAQALFDAGGKVFVENPARIKAHGQSLGIHSKTDKKDSFVIAHYGATMPSQAWQPEPPEIRELKALIARKQAVEKDLQREENRLEKAQISQSSAVVLDSIQTMITALHNQKSALKAEIDRHIDSHPSLKKDRRLLESIPGIGPVISALMLAVIHSRNFERATQCSAFLGLNPVQCESGTSVYKRPRLSKKRGRL